MTTLTGVFSPTYCVKGAAPLTSTTKQQQVVDRVRGRSLPIDWIPPNRPRSKSIAQIELVHDQKYVNAVLTGRPRYLAESQGFTWSWDLARSVVDIWGGQYDACMLALDTRSLVIHPVSGAHHAAPLQGSGFCTFNWLVGMVPSLPSNVDLFVLDFDAHLGDGSLLFLPDYAIKKRTFIYDIWGGPRQTRTDDCVRLYRVPDAQEYAYACRDALNFLSLDVAACLNQNRTPLVVYQAGVDPFEKDPVGGVKGMNWAALYGRDRQVLTLCRELRVATVLVLAGGYAPECVDLHVQTLQTACDIYT